GVGAERAIGETGGGDDARAAGGDAGEAVGVPGIERRLDAGVMGAPGELGGLGLADDDGAGGLQPRDGGGGEGGAVVLVEGGAAGGRGEVGEDVVLDGEGHAVEGPAPVAGGDLGLGGLRPVAGA